MGRLGKGTNPVSSKQCINLLVSIYMLNMKTGKVLDHT